jgi:hypothetical protein
MFDRPSSRFVNSRLRAAAQSPEAEDSAYVKNLMVAIMAPGQIANWISKPAHGIHGMPFEFEYVRKEP